MYLRSFKLFLTTYMKIKKIVCRKGCETSKHCLGHICYRYINHILTFQMSRDILLFQLAQCVLVHFGIFYQSEETSLQVYTYVSREVIQIRVMGTGSVIFVHKPPAVIRITCFWHVCFHFVYSYNKYNNGD